MTNWQGVYDMMKGGPTGNRQDFEEGAKHFGVFASKGAMPPQVITDTILWLGSDEGSPITGHAVPVDAGHMALPGFS